MNDADVIKAFECCASGTTYDVCLRCPLYNTTVCTETENGLQIYALDLIKRQKAEIERLQGYNENLLTANTALSNEILDIKTEAIKEFYEKIEEIITEIYNKHIFGYYDLEDEEKEAVMDFCNDIEIRISDFMEEITEGNNA